MRICRFSTGEEPRFGVVTGEVDEFGQPAEDSVVVALAGDPLYVGIKLMDEEHKLSDVRLLAPVHPAQQGRRDRPQLRRPRRRDGQRPARRAADVPQAQHDRRRSGRPDLLPAADSNLHYEGELAVVIGRICRDVPVEQATDVIFGYTIANDVTARDLQRSDVQFTRAKGFDSFCPLGPWIETDLDPQDFADGRTVQTYLNGDVVQDGSTADMIFDVPTLVAHVSSVMTLLPGDLILTGTPEGVGPMQVGDEVEISIAGIGALTNPVALRSPNPGS